MYKQKAKIKQNKGLKGSRGITLIALVITIIVLLILAAVSIATLTGDNGILAQAKLAKEKTELAEKEENMSMSELEDSIDDVLKKPVELPDKDGEIFSREFLNIDVKFLVGTSYRIGEANAPKIDSNYMIPVNWDGTNWIVTDEENWDYSYDEKDKKWANIMLRDTLVLDGMDDTQVQTATIEDMKGKTVTTEGSMFVWIPRYAYKITYYENEEKTAGTEVGYSDARGFVDSQGKTPVGMNSPVTSIAVGDDYYRPHPAFEKNGSTSSLIPYSQGEWDSTLQGIWIGKFGTTEKINNKVTVGPNKSIYIKEKIGTFYTDGLELEIANSHMAKNSEWGAMAYLTESKYGRDGVAVTGNFNSELISGGGDYKVNINQSTTNNIYGIYDTSGGAYEFVSSYIANNMVSGGNSFASNDNTKNNKTESTKYATVYEMQGTDCAENYNKNINKKFGDAVVETSTEGTFSSFTSLYGTCSTFPGLVNNKYYSFFRRSGWYGGQCGTFFFHAEQGIANVAIGFRVCLIVEN